MSTAIVSGGFPNLYRTDVSGAPVDDLADRAVARADVAELHAALTPTVEVEPEHHLINIAAKRALTATEFKQMFYARGDDHFELANVYECHNIASNILASVWGKRQVYAGTAAASAAAAPLTQLGLDIDGEAADDNSGYSVSLSSDGSIVAIGAPRNGGTPSGHVRVYKWNATSWVKLGNDIEGEAADDESGYSVSLSSDGTIVAIGATRNDGNGNNAGHVKVYQWNATRTVPWVQLGNDIDGEAVADRSGYSVSLSSDGTRVAIGAIFNDGNGNNAGHVKVYLWYGAAVQAWAQLGLDIDGEAADDESGYSVSLSSDGSIVAIGAGENDGNGASAGHVSVWKYSGSAWSQLGNDIDGDAAGDQSGYSVSLSSDGSIVAIGAVFNDGNGASAGHVRVYQWNATSWVQLGPDIDSEAAGDNSGWSVSLSSDGSIVAIGAVLNDGNGNNAGHVRVYQWNATSWVQLGPDIDGEAAGDQSGYSVSLSSDGTIVAIGAMRNGGNGVNSGHVRVYSLPTAPAATTHVPYNTSRVINYNRLGGRPNDPSGVDMAYGYATDLQRTFFAQFEVMGNLEKDLCVKRDDWTLCSRINIEDQLYGLAFAAEDCDDICMKVSCARKWSEVEDALAESCLAENNTIGYGDIVDLYINVRVTNANPKTMDTIIRIRFPVKLTRGPDDLGNWNVVASDAADAVLTTGIPYDSVEGGNMQYANASQTETQANAQNQQQTQLPTSTAPGNSNNSTDPHDGVPL